MRQGYTRPVRRWVQNIQHLLRTSRITRTRLHIVREMEFRANDLPVRTYRDFAGALYHIVRRPVAFMSICPPTAHRVLIGGVKGPFEDEALQAGGEVLLC